MLRIIKNKYFLTILAFLVWIVFFDSNNLISQFGTHQKYVELQEERAYYQQEIDKIDGHMEALSKDPSAVEKFAREKYLFKRAGEDIFLIEEPADN